MKKAKQAPPAETEEWWEIVRVASCIGHSYQTARNQMLQGIFGPSRYDAETRKLTVRAARVRKVRAESRKKRR